MDIRQKTLDIALDLVSPKNIEEVILVLKKEINKTQAKELDKVGISYLLTMYVGRRVQANAHSGHPLLRDQIS